MQLYWDETVGRGASGEIWRAKDDLGRTLAVKFFADADPGRAERSALAHASALVRVSHPAMVSVFAVERHIHPESKVAAMAIVMEYVPGPDLAAHVGSIEREHARAILADLTGALQAMHDVGLVHGDLHPGNVLLTTDGAKLIDILYVHSLAVVGTKTAQATRADDLRSMAGILRTVLSKSGASERDVAEAYYQATQATDADAVRSAFESCLQPINDDAASARKKSVRRGKAAERESRGAMNRSSSAVAKRPSSSSVAAAELVELVARIQNPDSVVSQCVAEVLPAAIRAHDDRLRALCELELAGFNEFRQMRGKTRDPLQPEDTSHREIEFYVGVGVEINLDHFGTGNAALSWMRQQPQDFVPVKFLYPNPLAEIERDAKRASLANLFAIQLPAHVLMPNADPPDLPLNCYASGDALARVLVKLRTLLTNHLLRHLPRA